ILIRKCLRSCSLGNTFVLSVLTTLVEYEGCGILLKYIHFVEMNAVHVE
uniref:Uncharacterized protein n=1 Tax=Rhinopithecus bieti TaxID=61621 RepID=A0A2K6MLX2_RHIBE